MKKNRRFITWLTISVFCYSTSRAQLPPGTAFTGHPLPYASYTTLRQGLPRFTAAVHRGAVTVAFLGGSITHNPGWRNQACDYLRARFPHTAFRFIAAGIPSLGSLPHAFRLQSDVLDSGRIDLLVLETAVNDRVNGTDSLTQLRSLEGIVRHAKRTNPGIDIVMMAFADPNKTADYDGGIIPAEIANQELVAGHYGFPSVNLGKEVRDKIAHGEFEWKKDFKDIHPSVFGEALYFDNLRQLLDTCLQRQAQPAIARLPPPLDQSAFDRGHYEAVANAQYDTAWRYEASWMPGDSAATRPGYRQVPVLETLSPGATLSFPFRGTAVGIAVVSGPDAGRIACSIDNGPYHDTELYTQWSNRLHLPWYVLLGDGLSNGRHVLHLRVLSAKDNRSRGTACRIVYFLVN